VIPIYAYTDIRGRFSRELSTTKDFQNLVSRTKNVAFDFADKIVLLMEKKCDFMPLLCSVARELYPHGLGVA
jgi:hypothetical protein